jgi:hypothetical protein
VHKTKCQGEVVKFQEGPVAVGTDKFSRWQALPTPGGTDEHGILEFGIQEHLVNPL